MELKAHGISKSRPPDRERNAAVFGANVALPSQYPLRAPMGKVGVTGITSRCRLGVFITPVIVQATETIRPPLTAVAQIA